MGYHNDDNEMDKDDAAVSDDALGEVFGEDEESYDSFDDEEEEEEEYE